ncbi:hypothetical protein [Rhizohabitans arisaemae]|uniref:hypothetical protein n=1 Tax=Rhizohabitans arisaemae TaxID=2720610 RepID=UPI0024B0D0B7|nr:hypothetical protein [Rhizohabitans arisaemae]
MAAAARAGHGDPGHPAGRRIDRLRVAEAVAAPPAGRRRRRPPRGVAEVADLPAR